MAKIACEGCGVPVEAGQFCDCPAGIASQRRWLGLMDRRDTEFNDLDRRLRMVEDRVKHLAEDRLRVDEGRGHHGGAMCSQCRKDFGPDDTLHFLCPICITQTNEKIIEVQAEAKRLNGEVTDSNLERAYYHQALESIVGPLRDWSDDALEGLVITCRVGIRKNEDAIVYRIVQKALSIVVGERIKARNAT